MTSGLLLTVVLFYFPHRAPRIAPRSSISRSTKVKHEQGRQTPGLKSRREKHLEVGPFQIGERTSVCADIQLPEVRLVQDCFLRGGRLIGDSVLGAHGGAFAGVFAGVNPIPMNS